jgi:hypothetical protein
MNFNRGKICSIFWKINGFVEGVYNYKIDLKIKEIICVKLKDDYSN